MRKNWTVISARWDDGDKHIIKLLISLVFREMQIKTTMTYHSHLLECPKFFLKRLTTHGIGKDVKKFEILYLAGESVKWHKHFGKQTVFKEVMCTPTKYYSHSTPRYLLKVNESIYPYKDLYTNVHDSFICNSSTLKTTEMSIKKWMDKQTVCHISNIMGHYLVMKEPLIYAVLEWISKWIYWMKVSSQNDVHSFSMSLQFLSPRQHKYLSFKQRSYLRWLYFRGLGISFLILPILRSQ